MHELIGYIQRITSFAICFIALLSHHHAPSVHKCRPQCSGTDTEKAVFHFVCIMRFCKKKKLKSANMYASINFIFLKILRSLVFWCFIWNIRRHRVKTREQECGDRALFSVWVLFCAHDGPTRPETAKKTLQKPFFSLFWVGFSELFKKNSVWNRLRGFFERSKKPDFAKKQPFFGLRLSFFRLFSRLFRGSLFLSKRLKKTRKSSF